MKIIEKALNIALFFLLTTLTPVTGWTQSDQHLDNGRSVRWHQSRITFVVDPSTVSDPALPNAFELVQQAARAWQGEEGVPTFDVHPGSLGELGYHPEHSDNASGIALYHHDFPQKFERAVLALTLLTRNSATGEIVDADIIVDAERNRFSVLTSPLVGLPGAPVDFQNVITHEFGHVLGLVEDRPHGDATMHPSAQPGEVSKRDLAPSDRESVVRAYTSRTVTERIEEAWDHASARFSGLQLLALLLIVGLVVWAYVRPRTSVSYAIMAIALLTLGWPTSTPVTTEHGLVIASHSFWSGRAMHTVATVQTNHGLERVERLGGRIGVYEQRVLDAPSGHELQTGTRVPVQN